MKPSSIRYEYSPKTSNTSLQPHIERHHSNLYMSLVKEKGWKITPPGILSQARSRAATVAVLEGDRPDRFTIEAFHEKLAKFIIVDDQVFILLSLDIIFMLICAVQGIESRRMPRVSRPHVYEK